MSEIRRVDPRRPYRITPNGVRRIVLGAVGLDAAPAGDVTASQQAKSKPLRTRLKPESWYMCIAHSSRGALGEQSREALAAAAILATPTIGVIAVILGELYEDAGQLGADLVAVIPDIDDSRFQPDRELAAVASLIETYQPVHVFFPDNVSGDGDLGRRLAAGFDGDVAAHVIEIDATHVAISWSGGAERARSSLPRFILLDAGSVDSNLPFTGAGEICAPTPSASVASIGGAYRDLGIEQIDASKISLEEADFIVSAGNGVRQTSTIETLARTLGAAVGASRVAVDDGKFPRDKQIGATGKTVSASAYIAVGISGAVQHLQGIKDCRHVIAINRDAGAPIVKRADLTVIGDAEDVMQALITRVSQARNQREIPEAQ